MLRTIVLGLGLLVMAAATAQERRAEDFRLSYAKAYGPWEVICGYFAVPTSPSCDLRFTDIYSPRPDFRAWLIFFVNGGENHRGPVEMQLRMEAQSSLVGGGFKGDGFGTGLSDCLLAGCTLGGERMAQAVAAMRQLDKLTLTFFDYGVERQDRDVPTDRFAEAWDDYAAQRAARGL